MKDKMQCEQPQDDLLIINLSSKSFSLIVHLKSFSLDNQAKLMQASWVKHYTLKVLDQLDTEDAESIVVC